MSCYRCSDCSLDLPAQERNLCPVCGSMLVYHVGRQPMADWKDRVRALLASEEKRDEVLWRLEQYLDMGFDIEDAENLASRRDVDWHLARKLVRNGCSHDLVIRIVS